MRGRPRRGWRRVWSRAWVRRARERWTAARRWRCSLDAACATSYGEAHAVVHALYCLRQSQ